MTAYASLEQVRQLGHPDVGLAGIADSELERVLAEAMDDVDQVVGGKRLPNGRALDPEALSAPQREAVARATTLAASHRVLLDAEDLAAADSFGPAGLTVLRAGRLPPTPAIAGALAGHGLIRRSGCASPPPPPPLDAA